MRLSLIYRGVSSTISWVIMAVAIVSITILSMLTLSIYLVRVAQLVRARPIQPQSISIHSITVYSNRSIRLALANNGGIAIPIELDIAITIIDTETGERETYFLTRGIDWRIEEVCLEHSESVCYAAEDRISIRPGEIVYIIGILPRPPRVGDRGYIVVLTPHGGKAEKAFVVERV